MTIAAVLVSAAETLRKAGVAEPGRESKSLLAFTLQKDTAFLIAHPEYELTVDERVQFERFLERRANREPFQYITGHQEFYGLDFEVTPDVLIPRPETEILVESAIELLSEMRKSSFCEIGVGSGCISTAILKAVPSATAVGIDISKSALAVAHRNAEKHGVDPRLDLRKGDLLSGLSATFDLIVSNPPYIPSGDLDSLQREVRNFEPRTALDGGSDGLHLIRKIVTASPAFLKPGADLLLEIGLGQADVVKNLFENARWKKVDLLPDLQGIPRIVRACVADLDPPQ